MSIFNSELDFFVLGMTSNIKDLTDSTFYLSYHAGIQPSEVDKLTTHEMRDYISLTKDRVKSETEEASSIASFFSKLLGSKKR